MIEVGNESKPKKLFTGLVDTKIIALNPTQAEAEKLGIFLREEPVYTSVDDDSGNNKIRLDFYLSSPELDAPIKLAMFLEDTDQISSSSKPRFINDYGQSSYSESTETILALESKGRKWFKSDGLRISKVGEVELMEFLRAWLSIGTDGKAKIDNISNLIKGNLGEILPYITKYPDRKVQVLLTVRNSGDNWYQGVYPKYFGRAGNKAVTWWNKHLDNLQNKPNYQNSLVFKEFDPLKLEADDDTQETNSNPWGQGAAE